VGLLAVLAAAPGRADPVSADAVTAAPSATVAADGAPARSPLDSAYRESSLRRTENVFFISLPFTALYAALLTGGVALAVEKGSVRRPEVWLGISMGLATTASAVIAWRDARAPASPPAALPAAAPAESGTILIDSPR